MHRVLRAACPLAAGVAVLAFGLAATPPLHAAADGATPGARAADPTAVFETNTGFAPTAVQYVARTAGGLVGLTSTGALITLDHDAAAPAAAGHPGATTGSAPTGRAPVIPGPLERDVVAEAYVGADAMTLRAEQPTGAVLTHMTGALRRHSPGYVAVDGAGLYPGIAVRWTGTAGGVETAYTVAPGADPGAIRWTEAGATAVGVDASGALVVTAPALDGAPMSFSERAPVAWQDTAAGRRAVRVAYSVSGATVGFAVGAHDARLPLVIDPTLTYATYLGGSQDEMTYGLGFMPDGDVVMSGHTGSTDFPTTPGAYQGSNAGSWDVFVTAIDPRSGRLAWSTYLGSSGNDGAFALAVNDAGDVAVTGFAGATGFPTTAGAYQSTVTKAGTGTDAFVSVLSPDGTRLLASTLAGGMVQFPPTDTIRVGAPDDEDLGTAVAFAPDGSLYVGGETSSIDFPVTVGAAQMVNKGGTADGFVAHVSADGTGLLASTYVGGLAYDFVSALTLDGAGNVDVAGETDSSTFPTTSGAYSTAYTSGFETFVTQLPASLDAITWSTLFGGSTGSNGFQYTVPGGNLVRDAAGDLVISGETNAVDLPVTAAAAQRTLGGQDDAFVAALSADGSTLRRSTYVGGPGWDGAFALAQDSMGDLWIAGYTAGPGLPLTADALQTVNRDQYQCGFVAELSADMSRELYATFLGGSTDYSAQQPSWDVAENVAVGPGDSVAVSGVTQDVDRPTTGDAAQRTYGGGYFDTWLDVFATAPAVTVPEAPAMPLLPTAAGLAGVAAVLRRRRLPGG